MISKIKIVDLKRYDAKQDGTPYLTKAGKRFTRTVIKDDAKWYSALDFNGWTDNWNIGDTINARVEETEWQGKKQYNIFPVTRLDELEARIEALEKFHTKTEEVDEDFPPELDPDDLPF